MDGLCEKASQKMTITSRSVRTEPHVLGTHSDVKREKQMQHLRQRDKGCCFCALKKKEIAAAGGWGSHRIPSAGLDG
jgi:hypothetical protein